MPPFAGSLLKHGISGGLLLVLGWLVYTILTSIVPKIEKLGEHMDFLSDAVYDTCDAKRPRPSRPTP